MLKRGPHGRFPAPIVGMVPIGEPDHEQKLEGFVQILIACAQRLPTVMRESLTWDQDSGTAQHRTITNATGISVYFTDPHSLWQRSINFSTTRPLLPRLDTTE